MAENVPKKGTNQFMRQGHTDGPFGNNVTMDSVGVVKAPAKEIKP